MNKEDFPLALNVKDIKKIMGIGINQAYELTRRKDFPVIKVGSRKVIPRDIFFQWLESTALNTGAS